MGGVLLVLLVVIGSVVVGLVRGGETGRLADAKLRLLPVLIAGGALSLGATLASAARTMTTVAPWMAVLGMIGLLAFALANRHQPGMLMIAVGLACNLLVFVLNGGMPVTDAALAKAGIDATAGPAPGRPDALHVLARDGGLVLALGDVLAVRPLRALVSIGDIAQYAGLFLLVQGVMVGVVPSRGARYELFDYRVR